MCLIELMQSNLWAFDVLNAAWYTVRSLIHPIAYNIDSLISSIRIVKKDHINIKANQ